MALVRASCFILHRRLVTRISRDVATKVGAIVGGQTSVKAPERTAFEKYLPPDVDIVSCHSLHGPTVSPEGEPLVSAHARSDQLGYTNYFRD